MDYRRPGEREWTRALACKVIIDGDMEVKRLRTDEQLQVLTDSAGTAEVAWKPMADVRRGGRLAGIDL